MKISAEKTKLKTDSADGIQRVIEVNGQKQASNILEQWLKTGDSLTKALTKLKPIWRYNNISLGSNMKLLRSLVISIFLYARESWTATAELEKRTFEMRCYRSLLNISYKDHITNEEVRKKIQAVIGDCDELQRKPMWFGHVSRFSGLAKTILQGTVKGKRRRGRQKKGWEDNIKEWTGMDFVLPDRWKENCFEIICGALTA
ncbi:MAG: hypothetical protein AB2693_17470 [Candidatus Thiodiazotropha sp.]